MMKTPIKAFERGRIRTAIDSMSLTEKCLFFSFLIVLIVSILMLIGTVNNRFSVEVPVRGGSMSEGVVGFPRFINPVIALTDADRDLTSLVYSGLLAPNPDGSYEPDLAEAWSVSTSGLVYTVKIREDARFHDGVQVTADDVIFTIEATQNPGIRSPRRASWDGVSIEKVNDREVRFILNRPFPPFLENLTIGIIPEHIWGDVDPEQFAFSHHNVNPIGSGPYSISSIRHSDEGVPISYTLDSFERHTRGVPYIPTLTLHFYESEEARNSAYESGNIEGVPSVQPSFAATISESVDLHSYILPRIFGVFFNQTANELFQDDVVREALSLAIDQERLVEEVLYGFGEPIIGPLPPRLIGESASEVTPGNITDVERAIELLENEGWQRSGEDGMMRQTEGGTSRTLSFTLSTSDTPELAQTALMLKDMWERVGAQVTIELHDNAELSQNVIRSRSYDALLFGEIVGRELDYFAFWHSSQRNDPGLNIALYANNDADDILSEARQIPDRTDRVEKLKQFDEIIRADYPAVFLYSPDFIYAAPKGVNGIEDGLITTPSERFMNVHEWYIYTHNLLNIFSN